MPRTGELARLSGRKAELIAESANQRQRLIAAVAQLQPTVSAAESGWRLVHRFWPLARVASALVGIWAPSARPGGWWRTLRAVWRLVTI